MLRSPHSQYFPSELKVPVLSLFRLTYYALGVSIMMTLGIAESVHGYVAKINDFSIELKDFQEFVDVQKFAAKEDKLQKFLRLNKTTSSALLGKYIDLVLLYQAADEAGYSLKKKNKLVVAAYEGMREEYLINLYVNRQIDISTTQPKEADLKREYTKNKARFQNKTFDELTTQEKQELAQISFLRKIEDKKRTYRLELEKRFNVKRTPRASKVVARVNNIPIEKKEVDELLAKESAKFGISLDAFQKKDPTQFKSIQNDTLNVLILQKMVILELEKKNFGQRAIVQSSLKFYQYQISINQYINNEIARNVPVSSQEIDSAFLALSQSRPDIQKMLPTQQEKLLRTVIIQNKLPEIIKELVNEKKEEASIRRNKKELALLK